MTAKHTNRLAREKSPYLLQHAHNPVDWFAWNAEAFAKARAENKPIFLSIGYSTCHWCHVMERETFENEAVGKFLGEHFVSIKVDREERPDVDKIYMTFVQSTIGGGGWPLNVFLTPDLKPFFGGTYFPPEPRHGRPSFLDLLRQIADLWQQRHGEVLDSAAEIHARLEAATAPAAWSATTLTADALRDAGQMFKRMFDPRHGGFGDAPKFPQPSIPALLLRYGQRFGDRDAVEMVLRTCDSMAAGGIHDQLGGGFARYAVDAAWLVPHFEKMLYDNAQLVHLYLDAHLISQLETQNPKLETRFSAVVRDILDYVLRDMTHPGGGFYSAEDADSEGHEGKFYCWTHDELSKLLTPEEFSVAAKYFGITKEGNFIDHSHPAPLAGQNELSVVDVGVQALACSGDTLKRELQQASLTNAELLAAAKTKMLAARATRIRPHLDDKILASWNGLMLGAFARAAAVLGEERYRAAAEKNVAFIQAKLWLPLAQARTSNRQSLIADSQSPISESQSAIGHRQSAISSGTLFHRWRDGERDNVQLLEAYAFQLSGVIELYETTLDPQHLDFAIALAEAMLVKFYDAANGGFWQGDAGSDDLILRVKDDYDGAEPSGNSVATLALLKLAAITGREDFRQPAEATIQFFAARLEKVPQAVAFMLHALDFWLEEPRRIVIAGDPLAPAARELTLAAHSVYQPNKVVLGNSGSVEPFATTLPSHAGAAAYVCTGQTCQPPTTNPAELRQHLA